MKPSRLFIHPTLPERKVRHGFNWGALTLSTLWAFSEELLPQAGRLFAAEVAAKLLCTFDSPVTWSLALMLTLAKALYCGWRGNDWIVQSLTAKGYRLV
ncbi:hypothetical protein G5B88_04395 [Herbaspirillum seropedicae]|uniref:Transmembrane protein n=1 Tax=Herbaspirillum seropedicae (strain SmR1) TaxID=757424 RepID=D8J052_HERSS|nr:hypothetical protein [Herbaspirillum seropedicae]ADJ62389.1 transmembrane protein [Herbaspirillum seropedicae SmR1]UMU20457.1 hypothetical protein G5B88_04395 [Herbaspirillum seropedicae]